MRVQYLLCACLLLCGCTKVSDLTHQKSKSTEQAPVTVKKTNKVKVRMILRNKLLLKLRGIRFKR